jgi:uracil-DNA glycosylase
MPGAPTKSGRASTESATSRPARDCALCPRLKAFRDDWRGRKPDWFNSPVPAFGPVSARLLVVGLAPGLQGANRTGRPFTGDYAGDLLYATLSQFGSVAEAIARIPTTVLSWWIPASLMR